MGTISYSLQLSFGVRWYRMVHSYAGPGGISTCVCCRSRASSDKTPNCGRNVIGGVGGETSLFGGSRLSGLSGHGEAAGYAGAFVQLVRSVGMKAWSGSVVCVECSECAWRIVDIPCCGAEGVGVFPQLFLR